MLAGTRDISTGRGAAVSRNFLLWLIATLLIAIAMATCPAYAFADEGPQVPEGVLTLEEPQDTSTAIPEGAITLDDGVSQEDAVAVSEDASTDDQAQEIDNTVEANAEPATEEVLAENQTTDQIESAEANAEQSPSEELAENQTADDSIQQAIAEDYDSSTPASDDEEIVAPASNDDVIDEPSVIDAAPNAPPAINADASNVNNGDVASNVNQTADTAQNADGSVAASNGSSTPVYGPVAVDLSTQGEITTQASGTIPMYFYDTFTGTGSTSRIGYETTVGPDNDYIYTPDGQFFTVSGVPKDFNFTGNNIPTASYKRYGGYTMQGWYIKFKMNGAERAMYFNFGTVNSRLNQYLGMSTITDISLHAAYSGIGEAAINYRGLDGSINQVLEVTGGKDTSFKIPIPDTPATYPSNFAGWYLWSDVDPVGEDFKTNSSSQPLTGNESMWDIIKRVRNISIPPAGQEANSAYTYNEENWSFITGNPLGFQFYVVAAYGDVSTTVSYDVVYTNTNASGTAISETETVTHGNATGQTQAAIALPSGFTNPTNGNYKGNFLGWSFSAGASAANIAAGASLSTVNNGSAPQTGQTYTLYAVWEMTPQTYTVIYNPNGWTGTGISSVTESNHQVVNSGSDPIKTTAALGWPASRTGFQFDGWNTQQNGSGTTYSAGTNLSALSPSADQTISLWAMWTALTYRIDFNYGGGSGPAATQYKNDVGATSLSTLKLTDDSTPTSIPSKTTVTKTGYVFDGWSEGGTKVADKDNNLTSAFVTAATASTTPHNFTAIWREISYTVNWYSQWTTSGSIVPESGKSASSGPYTYTASTSTNLSGLASGLSSTLTADVETVESGKNVKYTFAGWYVTKGGTSWKVATAGTGIGSLTLAQAIATAGAITSLDETAATGTITILGVWNKSGAKTVTYQDQYGPGTGLGTTASVYQGSDYRINVIPTNPSGYTFTGWKHATSGTIYALADIQKSVNDSTNTITNVQYDFQLIGQWTSNTVQFTFDANAGGESVTLNTKPNPTAQVGDTVKESDLTTATPVRNGYDFAGWARSSSGAAIIGPTDSDAKLVITASDAPSNPTNIKLYALWTPWTYTVRYWATPSTDTDAVNTVKVYKQVAAGDWDNLGTLVSTTPYTWTAKTSSTDTGLATPDIILDRDWYLDRNLVTWSITNGAGGTAITNAQTLGDLYAAQKAVDGRDNRVLDLYAMWTTLKYTVNYQAKNSNGTVAPVTETIDLAIGRDSDVQGSTATVTTPGYALAIPTWTDVSGNAVDGVSTTAAQSTYAPTVAYLRSLYTAVPSSTSYTFYANFEEAKYAYTVQAYMQKADGTWNAVFTTPNDLQWTQPGGKKLEGKFNSTVNYSDLLTGVTSTSIAAMEGRPLSDLALIVSYTDSIRNDVLYELDTSQGQLSISITSNASDNVLKLYYKRKTFALNAVFQTIDGSGTNPGAPASVVTTPASHLNGGNATTALRWGQSIPVTSPSATGYDFAWRITTPASATSSNPGTTFALNASDMNRLVSAGTNTAVLTGTFTVKKVRITLIDGVNSTKNWTSGTAKDDIKNNGTASKDVAYNETLATWLPSPTDRGNSDLYYLAGWEDSANAGTVIAPDTLRSMTNWDSPKTFTAVWLLKTVITYDPGAPDSYGNSKAAWTAYSTSVIDYPDPSSVLLSSTDAKFATLVGQIDSVTGNPLGANGWEFDYWTIDGDTSNARYGHVSAYTGPDAGPNNGRYLDGDSTTPLTGLYLNTSYKFIAHWKGTAQTLNFNPSGPEKANPLNSDTITATLPNPGTTYTTDDTVDLSDYTPTSVPAGYDFAGWEYTFTPAPGSTGSPESGTYAPGSTFHIKNGTTTLNPFFHEKTVTFEYLLPTGSAGKGNITPTTADTVFVVKHNGINAHTVTSTNATAYTFENWTYDSAQVTTDATIDQSKMGILATDILDADRTYYANFKTKQYTLTFDVDGTDGSTTMGSVVASGTGAGTNNEFTVDWNTTIPSGGIVTVTSPEGYELDGWIINGTGAPQVFPGGNAGNNQGVYLYAVTSDVTLTAHFKVSAEQNYTVKFNYDPEGVSLYTGTEYSHPVAWGESVLPTNANDRVPTQSGFTFDGWYMSWDSTNGYSTKIGSAIVDQFGTIYEQLKNSGAGVPNIDTTEGAKYITIYAKWIKKTFTVTYDLYGNVPNDAATPNDDVIEHNPIVARTDIGWNDTYDGGTTNTFRLDEGIGTFERPGYRLSGWSATYNSAGSTIQTSTSVLNSDTYGKLAGFVDTNTTVTLHAIWTSNPYIVQYIYNDTRFAAVPKSNVSYTRGWAEEVDYYSLGDAPTYDGYRFDGWDVEYVGGNPLSTQQGTRITAPANLTIRDIVGGDTGSIGTSPIIKFIASWTPEATYYFQDRLIHLNGTYTDRDSTSPERIDGDESVPFSEYGTIKTYNGYDFDNHVASNPNWNFATPNTVTAIAGQTTVFYVYYLERSYKIDFYEVPGDASAKYSTPGNAWDSAPAALPAGITPTRAGYTFNGWFLRDESGSNEVEIDGTNTIESTGLFPVAPANGTTLTAYGKWTEDTATITWNTADANGTTTPAPGSVTRDATSSTPVATIVASTSDTDYEFDKWTYSYIDPSDPTNPRTGTVTASSPFATLGGTGNSELTPIKWAMNTGDTAVWHDITFTAHFALSGAHKVTINYYLEDGNNLGSYNLEDSEINRDAVDGAVYNVTPRSFSGYSLNTGRSKLSGTYVFADPDTHVFDVYFDALPHTVTYRYVDTSGADVSAPTGAPALASFNNGMFYTGANYNVDAAPTLLGWEFDGWYLSTDTGRTNNISGTSITIADADLEIIGTWKVANHTVTFTKGSSAPAGAFVSMNPNSGYTVQHGYQVKTAVSPEPTSLNELGVTVNSGGAAYTVTVWRVLIGGVDQGIEVGDPLFYTVESDVTFSAVWSPTHAVTYTRGAHGNFMDSTNTNTFVKFDSIPLGESLSPDYDYNGTTVTVDGNQIPNAIDGWQWVGWGTKSGSVWTYYFPYDADVDYGTTVTGYTPGTMPSTVETNIEFVGFYKALERTLVFSNKEYDSTVAAGTESSRDFDPIAVFESGTTTSYQVKTGQNATMLGVSDISRDGFELIGWTDGVLTFTPSSVNEFVMPDGPTTQIVYLYPVFSFDAIEINYAVAGDSTGWGNVDRSSDTKTSPSDTQPIVGSKPLPNAGYEFDYWTKDSDTTPLTGIVGADGKIIPTESGTYYVHFKEKEYDFAYAKNPGAVGAQETLPATALPTDAHWTDSITLEPATRDGYTFTGWDVYATSDWNDYIAAYTADPETAVAPTPIQLGVAAGNTTVSALLSGTSGMVQQVTLVPTWTAKTYTVEFNDGKTSGTGTVSGMPSNWTGPFDANDIDASAPTRDGYDFGGWSNSVKGNTVAAGTLAYSDLVNDENDLSVTLTAIWNAKTHTITYVADTGDTWSTTAANYPAGDPMNTGTTTDATAAISTSTDAEIKLRDENSISRTGSRLMGWEDQDGNQYMLASVTTLTMPNDDVVLTPIWQEFGEYNVRFNPGAGVTDALDMPSDRTNIAFSTSNIDMSAPSRPGWTFDGWSSDVTAVPNPTAGTGVAYSDLVAGNDSIKTVTLTATWTQTSDYKVVFDFAAGSDPISNRPVNPQDNLKWNDTVTTKNISGILGRAGYTFIGWTIKDMNGGVLGGTDTIYFTADSAKFSELAQNQDLPERRVLTLVANWTPKTYEVEFLENKPSVASGTVSGMPATNPVTGITYDDTTGIDVPALTLAGYDFGGWTSSVSGSSISAGSYTYRQLSENNDSVMKVTLTAIWTPKSHSIKYEINASTDTWSSNAADYPVTEPATNRNVNPNGAIPAKTDEMFNLRDGHSVTRPGSSLLGWKDADGIEYLIAEGTLQLKVPNKDVTLTPIWQEDEDYNVIYLPGDAVGATKVVMSTMPADQTNIKYSATGISTASPTRPGYIFTGWANDAGSDVAVATTSASYATLSGNDYTKKTVTLTAKWNKDTGFKVTYADGVPTGSTPFTGTLPADIPSLGFDDSVPNPELNASGTDRVGFTFTGWRVTNDANGAELTTITSGYSVDSIYSELTSGDASIKAIRLTAMWEGTPYDVTYHLTDGNWITANIGDAGAATPNAAITYRVENTVPLRNATTVKRDGYELAGWATDTNAYALGYTEYLFASGDTSFTMPAHDVDLYPLWIAKTYTMYFVDRPESDTGTIMVDSSTMPTSPQTGEFEDTFTYGAPTRSGYNFGGWDVYKTDEYNANPATATLLSHIGAGSGTYASIAIDADIDALTLVAIWTAQSNGVTYVLDPAENASWVTANIQDAGRNTPTMLVGYTTDEIVNVREADTVKRSGYVLIGWKEDPSTSVTTPKYPFDENGHASFRMPATNVLLYPVWQIKNGYSVEFDGNAPTTNIAPGAVLTNVPDDQPVAPAVLTWDGGTSYVDTSSPSFPGYSFRGWDVYGTDGVKINTTPLIGPGYYFNTLAITDTPEHEHLKLVANWEIVSNYSVTFKDGVLAGDTPVTTGTMPSDAIGITYVTVVDYHAPGRVGYTFDGWDVSDITDPLDIRALPVISASDADGDPYYVLALNTPSRKALELTARWIVKTGYNVHFVDKPASDTGVTPVNMGSLTDYINITWDAEVIAYPAPTRTGYDFVHWAVTNTTDPDNVISIGTATAGSYRYSVLARERTDDTIMDITMTAIWKAHEWKVTYINTSTYGTGTWMKSEITDSGKSTPDAPITYAVDETVTLRGITTLVISGYKLVGWQDAQTSPTNVYMLATDTDFIMPDHDVNLYPIWEPKEYKVIFDENKPVDATDPSQIVAGMPPTQWESTDAQYPMTWDGDVDTKHPTLLGYEFTGWIIENASETGALTGLLDGTTYTFASLALTDTLEHETIKLIAQWRPASYRVNYVDGFDANGAAIATPVIIATDDTKLWVDVISDDDDPWTISSPSYTGKSSDDWQFDGWTVYNASTNTYVALSTLTSHVFGDLAKLENMTVADIATANETPALVLYANWTRRVPFIVDFMKRDGAGNDTLESSTTLVGLDGQDIVTTLVEDIATTWKDYVLNTVGPDHSIAGYEYSYTLSSPYVIGVLSAAGETLHVKLIYTQLADYTIIYDATPGALVADPTQHTASKGDLTWESIGSTFAPTDSDWFYVGHKIDGWTYGPTGTEFTFGPGVTFEQIAAAIYGTVDGSEGRDVDGDGIIEKAVTLFAKWVERNDYKVKYDNNYKVDDDVIKSGITDGRFLERVEDATYTPETMEDVAWSAVDIEPTETDEIVKPGVKGGKELYEIEGWNYLSKSGVQKPAEGKSFAEIVADMFDGEPDDNTITLYARYKEIAIKITYTPVLADDDGNIISMGASAAGTVSRTIESPDAVTGIIFGSTATPNRGYHFIGWRRLSDNETIYTSEFSALAAMASGKLGFNVLPTDLGGATLLLAAQNSDDGYWHDEEYLALFAQNEIAILHYDKNAEDATGYIADVEAPYETLITLSDGSGYTRKYWTLVSWNTEPDGSGTTYALSEKDWEMPQGETTLYAQWVKNKASITYIPGGEDVTGIPEGITDEWGTSHPISTDKPKRDHYTFIGWNTKEDGTGTWYYGGEDILLPGDGLPLYAQWEINKYTASVDPGPYPEGEVTYTGTGKYVIEHGGYLPEGYVTATPKDGYHVSGWKYTMIDEYGNVITGTIDDPTKLRIVGDVTFSPIFEKDADPSSDTGSGSGNGGSGDGTGYTLDTPKTGDEDMSIAFYVGIIALMMLLFAAARRRRREED